MRPSQNKIWDGLFFLDFEISDFVVGLFVVPDGEPYSWKTSVRFFERFLIKKIKISGFSGPDFG